MSLWDAIGLGALNWDLIYELTSLNILDDLNISITSGEEIHLKASKLLPVLALLDRYGIKRAESGGGQAANTVYALSRMGFKTKLFGKVGQDRWGDLILQGLCGVDTTAVIRGGESGICISILTPDGHRSMIAFPRVNDTLNIKDFDVATFSASRFLHLTSFADPRALKAQIQIVRKLAKRPLITFDPGSLYARLGLDVLVPILEVSYCLFATDTELEMMTGLDHRRAAKQVLDLGVRMVVCKQGARGAYLIAPKRCWEFPSLNVELKDATGAGDCFAAGFLAGLLKGFDLDTCGRLGTQAAASCIQGYGRESYPDQQIWKQVPQSDAS